MTVVREQKTIMHSRKIMYIRGREFFPFEFSDWGKSELCEQNAFTEERFLGANLCARTGSTFCFSSESTFFFLHSLGSPESLGFVSPCPRGNTLSTKLGMWYRLCTRVEKKELSERNKCGHSRRKLLEFEHKEFLRIVISFVDPS